MTTLRTEPREVTAAVLRVPNGHFAIERLTIDEPSPGEVLVEIVATGICHTDAAVRSRALRSSLPAVLGHEGAGRVLAIGRGVRKVVPGDAVVLTFNSCGQCDSCLCGRPSVCSLSARLNFGGSRLDGSHGLHSPNDIIQDQFFGQSSFASLALANERNVVKVSEELPLDILGPLGCGIQTGAGAILNVFQLRAGQCVAVFGSGAVGLSAIMAARLAGAARIIAVDIIEPRLQLAKDLGATHAINSRHADAYAAILDITGTGAEFTLDTTGRTDVIQEAIKALRPGGTCGVLGAGHPNVQLSFDYNQFMGSSKILRGIVEGDSVPELFIPQLIALHVQGRFPFERMIKFYDLDQINAAFDDAETGLTVKPVVRMVDTLRRSLL